MNLKIFSFIFLFLFISVLTVQAISPEMIQQLEDAEVEAALHHMYDPFDFRSPEDSCYYRSLENNLVFVRGNIITDPEYTLPTPLTSQNSKIDSYTKPAPYYNVETGETVIVQLFTNRSFIDILTLRICEDVLLIEKLNQNTNNHFSLVTESCIQELKPKIVHYNAVEGDVVLCEYAKNKEKCISCIKKRDFSNLLFDGYIYFSLIFIVLFSPAAILYLFIWWMRRKFYRKSFGPHWLRIACIIIVIVALLLLILNIGAIIVFKIPLSR